MWVTRCQKQWVLLMALCEVLLTYLRQQFSSFDKFFEQNKTIKEQYNNTKCSPKYLYLNQSNLINNITKQIKTLKDEHSDNQILVLYYSKLNNKILSP